MPSGSHPKALKIRFYVKKGKDLPKMDLKEYRKPYFSLIAKEVGGALGMNISDALEDLYSL